MTKKDLSPQINHIDILGTAYRYRYGDPLKTIIEQSEHRAFSGSLGTFIRAIVTLHQHESEGWPEESRIAMYRLSHMMEAYVMCYENSKNGLQAYILMELKQELILGCDDYLPKVADKKGYRAFFEELSMTSPLEIYQEFLNDISGLQLKANEGWGLRLLTETYLWYGVCTIKIREIADQIFATHHWNPREYIMSNTPLNSIRKMVKSCHLSHDDYQTIPYVDSIRMIVWFNGVMGNMGQRVQNTLMG